MKYRQGCQAAAWAATMASLLFLGACSGSISTASMQKHEKTNGDTVDTPSQTAMSNDGSEHDNAGVPATVFGIDITATHIRFDVLSNGCTKADDFRLVYGEPESGDIPVTLMRLREDPCRKMPEPISIQWPIDTEAVNELRVVVTNRLEDLPVIKRQ